MDPLPRPRDAELRSRSLFYNLLERAKLAGVGPHTYLKAAIQAALRGTAIPLPHDLP